MIRLTTCANDAYCSLFDESSRMTLCSISTVQYINSFCMQRPVFILLDIRGCASVSEQKPLCCVSWICLFCCKAAVIAGPSALLCKATPPSRTRYVLLVRTGLSVVSTPATGSSVRVRSAAKSAVPAARSTSVPKRTRSSSPRAKNTFGAYARPVDTDIDGDGDGDVDEVDVDAQDLQRRL